MPEMIGQADLKVPKTVTLRGVTNDHYNYFAIHILSNPQVKEQMFGNKYLLKDEMEKYYFYMDGEGRLKHAWGITKDATKYFEAFATDNLFIRDSNGMLRQIQYIEPMGYDISRPYEDVSTLPEPKRPNAMKRFLNYLFGFFEGDFKAYERQLAMRDELSMDHCDVARGLEPRSGKPIAADPQPEPEPVPQVVFEDEEPEIPENETPDQFEERLNRYSEYSKSTMGVVMMKSFTMENLIDRMTNRARRMAAIEILNAIEDEPQKREQLLSEAKEKFDNMIKDIKAFAPKTIDPADVNVVLTRQNAYQRNEEGDVIGLKLDFTGETLLENYRNYEKAGRVDTFRQRKYINPLEFKNLLSKGRENTVQYCAPYSLPKEKRIEIDGVQPVIQQPTVRRPIVLDSKPQVRALVDTRNMTPQEFKSHLLKVHVTGSNTNITDVLANKTSTPESYYQAVADKMEDQVAVGILGQLRNNPDPDKLLNEQKMIYTSLVADLKAYVTEHTDKKILTRFFSKPNRKHDDMVYLVKTATAFTKTGVNDYLALTKEKNAQMEQSQQQENQTGLQNNEAEVKKQDNPIVPG